MTSGTAAKRFVQMFSACVSTCATLDPEDRVVATRHDISRRVWIIGRGLNHDRSSLFLDDPSARRPIQLIRGGEVTLYVSIRETGNQAVIASYRFGIINLPDNSNDIKSLRYDRSEGHPSGIGWVDELDDNPHHPWGHLHVNFASSQDANDLRLPTGNLNPILLLRAFDHWYWSRFNED